MTTYEIPDEPQAEKVWTHDQQTGEPIEWRRDSVKGGWFRHGIDATATSTWLEVVTQGPVHDVHPDLADVPPTPWSVDWTPETGDDETLDALGEIVPFTNESVRQFIVRAVNELAARVTAGEVPSPAAGPGLDELRAALAGPTSTAPDAPRHVESADARTLGELANLADDVVGNHGQRHSYAPVMVVLGDRAGWASEVRWDGGAGVLEIRAGVRA